MAPTNKTSPQRIWELDVLRGTALVMMVFFHLLFNLNEIYGYAVQYNRGVYYYMGKIAAIMFILIAGISCSLSRSNLRRGVRLLVIAMVITIVTHLYGPAFGIKFGILHFLGVSMLLYPVFRGVNKYLLIVLGILMVKLGQYLGGIPAPNNYLFIFNLTGSGWVSADYYPVLPWLGIFLLGISAGKIFYPEKKGLFGNFYRNNILACIGRHTLFVYLVHQPILIAMIALFRRLTI